MLHRLLLTAFLLTFGLIHADTQEKNNSCAIKPMEKYALDVKQATDIYQSIIYNPLDYIYGKEYKIIYRRGRPTPYLNSEICEGTVFYKGFEYPKVYIIYNVFSDDIIVNTNQIDGQSNYIQLKKTQVDSFYLISDDKKYTLKKKYFPAKYADVVKDGFYEEIYQGSVELLLKHKVTSNAKEGYDEFYFSHDLLLKKNGEYYNISKKNRLLKQFPEYKKNISKKMREFQTSYKKLNRQQLLDLFTYIEDLT